MDEPVAESSIGNSYEAPRTGDVQQLKPCQSTIQALSNATQKHSEAEKRNLTNRRQ